MESNLKYKKAFLIIGYVILLQFFILPFYDAPILPTSYEKPYLIFRIAIFTALLSFLFCVHFVKLVKYWVIFFHICCFSFTLVGQFFNPGYHFAVIQFMFVCAIVFEGFPWMSTLLMVLSIVEYSLHPFLTTFYSAYPAYHREVLNAVISSWIISVAMERYVNRVKNRRSFLDKKLRYKGIKTDLFLHELKNKLQPLVPLYPNQTDFKEIVKTIQSFNSFNEEKEINFSEIVQETHARCQIVGEYSVTGKDEFFIDQIDLQTILYNLMNNSHKASLAKNIYLHIRIKNKSTGFVYEDNAGGMSDEQYKHFTQKNFQPYPGHEKNGLGLLLIKKLVGHYGGRFIIRKISNGMRFEISF